MFAAPLSCCWADVPVSINCTAPTSSDCLLAAAMPAALQWHAASGCIVCSMTLQARRQCVMRMWAFRADCRLVAVGKEGSRYLEGSAGSPGRCILTLQQQVPILLGSS